MIRSVCVFCGSSSGKLDEYRTAATVLGELLADRHIRLVYGGAAVGLMGTIADACLSQGGEVIGVIPRALVDKEIAHRGLTELRVVQTMHERKALMSLDLQPPDSAAGEARTGVWHGNVRGSEYFA